MPFCFARYADVVENARVECEDVVLKVLEDLVRELLAERERERKDWRRGVRSLDVLVWGAAIVLAFLGVSFEVTSPRRD